MSKMSDEDHREKSNYDRDTDNRTYNSSYNRRTTPRSRDDRDDRENNRRHVRRDQDNRSETMSPKKMDGDVWDHDGWEEMQKQQPAPRRTSNGNAHDSRGRRGDGRRVHQQRRSTSREDTDYYSSPRANTEADTQDMSQTPERERDGPTTPLSAERERREARPDRQHYAPPRGKFSSTPEGSDAAPPAPEDPAYKRNNDRSQTRVEGRRQSSDRGERVKQIDRSQEVSPKFTSRTSGEYNPDSQTPDRDHSYKRNSKGRGSGQRHRRTSEDGNPVLMVLSIAIGDREEPLEVRQGEDPRQLSKEFCDKHNVPEMYLNYIAEQIETNVAAILAKNG